jgi:hypothetical protein
VAVPGGDKPGGWTVDNMLTPLPPCGDGLLCVACVCGANCCRGSTPLLPAGELVDISYFQRMCPTRQILSFGYKGESSNANKRMLFRAGNGVLNGRGRGFHCYVEPIETIWLKVTTAVPNCN